MRAKARLGMLVGAMVTLTACGAGQSATFSDPPLPTLTSPAASPSTAVPSTAAHRHRHHALAGSTATAAAHTARPPAAVTSAARPTTPATHRPSPTRVPSPSHSPSASPTPTCAGITGSTTTVQEQAGDKFAPSSVAISRCDSVKAVYSDTTGVPHTFTGPGWDSGSMSSGGRTSYTYRFVTTGTFHFYCSYHQSFGMTGTVTVT